MEIGAVSSSARSQALAAEPLQWQEPLFERRSCCIACVDGKYRPCNVFRFITKEKLDRICYVVDVRKTFQRASALDLLTLLVLEALESSRFR